MKLYLFALLTLISLGLLSSCTPAAETPDYTTQPPQKGGAKASEVAAKMISPVTK